MAPRLMLFAILAAPLSAAPVQARFATAFMPLGAQADAPRGFIAMCQRDSAACEMAGGTTTVATPRPPVVAADGGAMTTVNKRDFIEFPPLAVPDRPYSAGPLAMMSGTVPAGITPTGAPTDGYVAGKIHGPDGATLPSLPSPDWLQPSPLEARIHSTEPTASAGTQFKMPFPVWLSAIDITVPALPMSTAITAQQSPTAVPEAQPSSLPSTIDESQTAHSSTLASLKLLKQVNRQVNGRVRQKADDKLLQGGEIWRETGRARWATGDCEDIALQKRRELLEAGFAPQHLFLAVVFVRRVGLHTVLVGRTETGDFVLDSMTPYVTHWSKVRYSWLRIQSGNNPMDWRMLGHGAPVQMAALIVGKPPGGGR